MAISAPRPDKKTFRKKTPVVTTPSAVSVADQTEEAFNQKLQISNLNSLFGRIDFPSA